jgi:hypothetical protein
MAKESATATLERLRAGWQRGGRANTAAQNAARRQNATRAGRPGRVCVFCAEPVLGGHVDRRRDETCGAHGWRWAQRGEPARAAAPDPQLLPDLLKYLASQPALPGSRHARLVKRLRARLDALA